MVNSVVCPRHTNLRCIFFCLQSADGSRREYVVSGAQMEAETTASGALCNYPGVDGLMGRLAESRCRLQHSIYRRKIQRVNERKRCINSWREIAGVHTRLSVMNGCGMDGYRG